DGAVDSVDLVVLGDDLDQLAARSSKRTKLRTMSRNRAGSKTPRTRTSSAERPSISAGSMVFHSAKCSAGVVIVPSLAWIRSETPTSSTKRYSFGIVST